jgi:hypothetical protein
LGVSSWDFSREVSTLTPGEYSEQPEGVFKKGFEENDAVLAQVEEFYKKLWARKTAMMQTFVKRIESDDDKMRYYEKTNNEIFEVRNTLKTGSYKMGKFVGKDLLKRKKEEKEKGKAALDSIEMPMTLSQPQPLLQAPPPPPQQQYLPQQQQYPQPQQRAQTLQSLLHQHDHEQAQLHQLRSEPEPHQSRKQSKKPRHQQQPQSQQQQQQQLRSQPFAFDQVSVHRLKRSMTSSHLQRDTKQTTVSVSDDMCNLSTAMVQGSATGGAFPWSPAAVVSSSVASSAAVPLPARLPGAYWPSVPETYPHNHHTRNEAPTHLYAEVSGIQRDQECATRQLGVGFEKPASATPTELSFLQGSHSGMGMNVLEPSQHTYLASVAYLAPLSQRVASSTAPLFTASLSASGRDAQAQQAQFRAKMTGATEKMNGVMNVQREWEQENLQGSFKASPF